MDVSSRSSDVPNVLCMYWGRRGALTRFSLDFAREVYANPATTVTISVSRENAAFEEFNIFGKDLFPVSTFSYGIGALARVWSLPTICAALRRRLIEDKTRAVIDLMPHVWSPVIAPVVKSVGAAYIPVMHDADPHPGDLTSLAKGWLDRSMKHADLVVTLSGAVAGRLEALGRIPRHKIVTLFHPDLNYADPVERVAPHSGKPARLLFMGRIMDYKGLPLFLDAVEILKGNGVPVEIGVFGEGNLGSCASRLRALGAEVINRWLSETEISEILSRFDVMVLSHVEASQSGVAAAALGSGMPVVATPVGGLIEQVLDGRTGVLALRADALALSEALEDLLLNPVLYNSICAHIAATRESRSMGRFSRECVAHSLRCSAGSSEGQGN
jgi:glycosyltransferase involved in cell wall biosynthesis